MAIPCTSSASAAVTTSSTERLCPRWTTSTPFDCRMRRMMLIEASWPSNSEAAVTKRILLARRGWSCTAAMFGVERSFIGVPNNIFCRLYGGSSGALLRQLRQQARLVGPVGGHGGFLHVAKAAHFLRQRGQVDRRCVVVRIQLVDHGHHHLAIVGD